MKVLILGSSPNAFAAALTLADAGHTVEILETASELGAPYVTIDGGEAGLAYPHFCPVLAEKWNLPVANLAHTGRSGIRADGSWLHLRRTGLIGATEHDSKAWPHFMELMGAGAELLYHMYQNPQPPAFLPEAWRELGRRQSMEVLRLPWMSLRDLLDEWFEDQTLKGILAEAALEGVAQGPFASGTAYSLMGRWANGQVLSPMTMRGGCATFFAALKASLHGRPIQLFHYPGMPVLAPDQRSLIVDTHAFEFDFLFSDKDARWTYTQLVNPRYLETEFNSAIRNIHGRGVWQRGLGTCPFPAHWPEEARLDLIHWEPGLVRLEKAWDRVKRNLDVEEGPLQLCWPGLLDDSRPADLVQETFGYGSGWMAAETGQAHLDVQNRRYFTPVDYERDWQFTEGHLFGADRDLSQSFFLRPIPDYEAPLENIELCGSALHPANHTGRSGHWKALELIGRTAAQKTEVSA
jgi:phytoene dehydrogenase-like protein